MVKCKAIHYGQNNHENDYRMNNKNLKSVDKEGDLGMTFSRDLKFSQHISKETNTFVKANTMLALIELFQRTCSMKRRLSIYFTSLHVSKTRAWSVLS